MTLYTIILAYGPDVRQAYAVVAKDAVNAMKVALETVNKERPPAGRQWEVAQLLRDDLEVLVSWV